MNQLQQMTTEGGVPVIEATLKSKIQKVKTMIDDFNNKLAATKAQSDSYQESYKEIEGKLDDLENDIKSKETYETDLSILETNLKDAITKSLVNGTLNQEPFNTFCQEIKETNDRLRQDTLSICNMYSNDLWVIQLKRKIYKCFDEPDNATFETISKEYSALFEKHFKCELNQDSTNLEDVTLACHHLAKYYAVLPEWSLAEEEQIDQSSKFKTVKLASKENDIKALQVEPTINSTKPVEPTSKPTKSFSSNNTTIGGKTKSGSMEAQPLPRRESSLNNLRPVSTFLPYGHNTSVVSFNSFDEQTAASGQNNQRHNVPDSPVNHIPQQLAKRKPTLDELRSRTKAEFNLNSKKQLEKSWKRHLDMKKDSCDCIMCCCLSQEPLYRYCQMQCPKLCYMQDIHKLAIEKKEKCVCANCKDEESYLSGLLAIHRGLVTISSIERSQQMHRISKLPALPPPPLSSSSQQQQLAYRPLPPPPPQHEGMNTTTSYESNQNHPFQHNRTQVEFPNKKLAPSIEHLDKQKGFLNKLKDNLLK
jgi:hypothetical protein